MIKTITLDGLTSVKIKQSAFDMERFCWVKNRSDGDIFISCTDVECTENGDNVMKISAGEYGMIDSENREILYLNGSGKVEIVTSAYAVCPFKAASKGGETGGGLTLLYSGALSSSSSEPTTFDGNPSAYTALVICVNTSALEFCSSYIIPTSKISSSYITFGSYGYNGGTQKAMATKLKYDGVFYAYGTNNYYPEITVYGI